METAMGIILLVAMAIAAGLCAVIIRMLLKLKRGD